MGIENITRLLGIYSNQSVAILDERCVRLSCEKHRHTSQRQPMRLLGTNHRLRSDDRALALLCETPTHAAGAGSVSPARQVASQSRRPRAGSNVAGCCGMSRTINEPRRLPANAAT